MIKEEIDNLPTLRSPVSDEKEALTAQAIKEWLRFEKCQGLEHHDPFYKYVGQMWQAIHINLNGKDKDTPWSAAAISFMIRNAGESVSMYKKFKFAASHSRYMHDSIIKREADNNTVPFWSYRLHESIQTSATFLEDGVKHLKIMTMLSPAKLSKVTLIS